MMDVLILYGEVVGFFDLWQVQRFREKVPFGKAIVVARKEPAGKVLEEAAKGDVEIRVARDPKGEARKIAQQLREEGREVRVRSLEEVADRSMMRDVF